MQNQLFSNTKGGKAATKVTNIGNYELISEINQIKEEDIQKKEKVYELFNKYGQPIEHVHFIKGQFLGQGGFGKAFEV